MVEPVKVTIELGQHSSRLIRLLRILNGGTLTSAAKAMIDLGCSVASDRINAMSRDLAPEGTDDVRAFQDSLLAGDDQD